MEVCGPNAHCDAQSGRCVCDAGSEGDPQERCFPRIASLCNCREIELDTGNPEAVANQEGSFGTYFLFGGSAGYPVYQHRAGLLFLYQQDGTWLISNEVGSLDGLLKGPVQRDQVWATCYLHTSGSRSQLQL